MADYGTKVADATQRKIERRLRSIYRAAYEELTKELSDFKENHRKADETKRKQRDAGVITDADYRDWLAGQQFIGKQWEAKVNHVSDILLHANEEAVKIINGEKMNVFAENANYQAYKLEKDANLAIGFGIYDADAVGRLIRDEPELLPRKVVDGKKDRAWSKKQVATCVAQGIIQGNSIDKIAERIARHTANSDMKAMTRYARTAITGAQNAGRIDTMHRAQGMGIKVKKKWLATLDGRTRDSHAKLDGQIKEVDQPFESMYGEIMYPGDPDARPADIWNCRCTLEYVYPDFADLEESAERYDQENGEDIEDMTYNEWTVFKQNSNNDKGSKTKHNIVNGTDITGTWTRRADKFDFEIDDVINAQGFDGLPRVVSQEEFDRCVEESGLYAQRVYSAQTEEALETYRKELYDGKFYVDCSVGGADFGQGMYMSGDFTGKKVKDVMEDSDRYVAISESRGNKHSFVEKMTLDKDSKIATYDSLLKKYQTESVSIQNKITSDVGHKLVEDAVSKYGLNNDDRNFLLWGLNIPKEIEPFDVMKASKYSGDKKFINSIRSDISSKIKAEKSANPIVSANGDMGIYGTIKGYDAINIEGQAANGASQVLVLNRTKLIILGGK